MTWHNVRPKWHKTQNNSLYETTSTLTMTPDVQYSRLLKTFNADSHLVCRRRSSFSSSCGMSLPQQNNLQIDQSIPLESNWELACGCVSARLRAWVGGLLVRMQIIRGLTSATNRSKLKLKQVQRVESAGKVRWWAATFYKPDWPWR